MNINLEKLYWLVLIPLLLLVAAFVNTEKIGLQKAESHKNCGN